MDLVTFIYTYFSIYFHGIGKIREVILKDTR